MSNMQWLYPSTSAEALLYIQILACDIGLLYYHQTLAPALDLSY